MNGTNNNYYGNNFCPYCGKSKLTIDDKYCHYCKQKFNPTRRLDNKTFGILILGICFIFSFPALLFGSIFLGIGLFSYNEEHSQAEGYIETTGYFVKINYDDCTYDDGEQLCKAIYEYEVNGVTYEFLTDYYSNDFDDEKEIYYNPDKPSEAMIFFDWWIFIIIGGTIASFGVISIIVLLIIWLFNRKKCN